MCHRVIELAIANRVQLYLQLVTDQYTLPNLILTIFKSGLIVSAALSPVPYLNGLMITGNPMAAILITYPSDK